MKGYTFVLKSKQTKPVESVTPSVHFNEREMNVLDQNQRQTRVMVATVLRFDLKLLETVSGVLVLEEKPLGLD